MDEYISSQGTWSLVCPGNLEEVSRVRRWTRDILRGLPCADDAALIVSELGSNALLHTASGGTESGALSVLVMVGDHLVSISVLDSGGTKTEPRAKNPTRNDTHGRGLQLVHALAANVSIQGDTHGRVITAHLYRDGTTS